jgi:hypothetical protein
MIPEPYLSQWNVWLQGICKLLSFCVDRCIKPQGFGEIIFAECHHFSDASETGYGIVTYIIIIIIIITEFIVPKSTGSDQ